MVLGVYKTFNSAIKIGTIVTNLIYEGHSRNIRNDNISIIYDGL